MQSTTKIAENHIRISRALFNEGMRAAESKTYKKTIFLMSALYLIAAVCLWHTGAPLFFLLGELLFLGMLLFWLLVILPGKRRRSKYKAMIQDTVSIPERTIIFYQTNLSVTTNTGKETIVLYDDIQNWQETRNLYILICKNNIRILLDKKGFTAGDFQIIQSVLFS